MICNLGDPMSLRHPVWRRSLSCSVSIYLYLSAPLQHVRIIKALCLYAYAAAKKQEHMYIYSKWKHMISDHSCRYVYTRVFINIYIYIYTYIYIMPLYTLWCALIMRIRCSERPRTHVWTFKMEIYNIGPYICTYAYMYIYINMYLYTYTYKYIHTYR